LGQTRSTILHRIPHSMVWNSCIFQKKNKWFYILNEKVSIFLLSTFLHFSANTSKLNWYWRDNFINYLNNLNKYTNNTSNLTARFFFILNNPSRRTLLQNTNNWSNDSIQGKLAFFDVNNNLYCLNSYYLQNFSRIKKPKIKKIKTIFICSRNNLYKSSKIVLKNLKNKIKFKIKIYKNIIKSNYFLDANTSFIFKYLTFSILMKNTKFKDINTTIYKPFNLFLNKDKLKQHINLNNYLKYSSNLFYFFKELDSDFFLEILYINIDN